MFGSRNGSCSSGGASAVAVALWSCGAVGKAHLTFTQEIAGSRPARITTETVRQGTCCLSAAVLFRFATGLQPRRFPLDKGGECRFNRPVVVADEGRCPCTRQGQMKLLRAANCNVTRSSSFGESAVLIRRRCQVRILGLGQQGTRRSSAEERQPSKLLAARSNRAGGTVVCGRVSTLPARTRNTHNPALCSRGAVSEPSLRYPLRVKGLHGRPLCSYPRGCAKRG